MDLNPIEEALAYKKWLEDSQTTQETLAKTLGRDRSTITNMLRLLMLPKTIQKDLIEGQLSMGHARVLAGIKGEKEQIRIRDLIIKNMLSVRQTETLIKKEKSATPSRKRKEALDDYLKSLMEGLKRSLGTKVEIKSKGKRGVINIYYYSDKELDRILDLLR